GTARRDQTVAARALEGRAQFGIDPIKAGRDHHVHIGGRRRTTDRQDSRTEREEPSNERSRFHKASNPRSRTAASLPPRAPENALSDECIVAAVYDRRQ